MLPGRLEPLGELSQPHIESYMLNPQNLYLNSKNHRQYLATRFSIKTNPQLGCFKITPRLFTLSDLTISLEHPNGLAVRFLDSNTGRLKE